MMISLCLSLDGTNTRVWEIKWIDLMPVRKWKWHRLGNEEMLPTLFYEWQFIPSRVFPLDKWQFVRYSIEFWKNNNSGFPFLMFPNWIVVEFDPRTLTGTNLAIRTKMWVIYCYFIHTHYNLWRAVCDGIKLAILTFLEECDICDVHQESCLLYIHTFLPPAKRSCGKVMFLVGCVCQSVKGVPIVTTHESVQTCSMHLLASWPVNLRLKGLLVFLVILTCYPKLCLWCIIAMFWQ